MACHHISPPIFSSLMWHFPHQACSTFYVHSFYFSIFHYCFLSDIILDQLPSSDFNDFRSRRNQSWILGKIMCSNVKLFVQKFIYDKYFIKGFQNCHDIKKQSYYFANRTYKYYKNTWICLRDYRETTPCSFCVTLVSFFLWMFVMSYGGNNNE